MNIQVYIYIYIYIERERERCIYIYIYIYIHYLDYTPFYIYIYIYIQYCTYKIGFCRLMEKSCTGLPEVTFQGLLTGWIGPLALPPHVLQEAMAVKVLRKSSGSLPEVVEVIGCQQLPR